MNRFTALLALYNLARYFLGHTDTINLLTTIGPTAEEIETSAFQSPMWPAYRSSSDPLSATLAIAELYPSVPLATAQFAQSLRDAQTAHTIYEKQIGTKDPDWATWYAQWLIDNRRFLRPTQSQKINR
jgi:hypothetical protein